MDDGQWFDQISKDTKDLLQGELLVDIEIPIIKILNNSSITSIKSSAHLTTLKGMFIVLTQSCDLEESNAKTLTKVVLAQVSLISDFVKTNPKYAKKENIVPILEQKKLELFSLLAPSEFDNPHEMLIVSLFHIELVDQTTLRTLMHKNRKLTRYRLRSPYTENLSHRFGNLFSRVAIQEKDFPNNPHRQASIQAARDSNPNITK